MEERVIEDLPPPLHFRRTADGIQVGHDLPIYLPVPNDWYHGPTKTIDVQPSEWKKINLAPSDEEPRMIKLGVFCALDLDAMHVEPMVFTRNSRPSK